MGDAIIGGEPHQGGQSGDGIGNGSNEPDSEENMDTGKNGGGKNSNS
jgi:hypothetical protein